MTSRPDRLFFRLVVIGVMAAALAGCGRKGALDLPPGASATSTTTTEDKASPTLFGNLSGSEATRPPPPLVPNRRIPLDVLLN